ncbi:MAG: malto-oligosyltrehalose trehalohydrolase, partial [Firmicutes bacterium]|nr:malto-oligosyltrehalose trehalohydrolase [Bacillota bacterium]
MMIMGANILNREKSIIEFRTISINSKKVSLLLKQGEKEIIKHMEEERPHIYITRVEGMGLDLLYKYRLEGKGDFPDPYSHYQPEGVHGYSQVVDHGSYEWRDSCWQGLDLEDYIIYELHVGTFSPEGTFKGVEQRLDYLKDLGITAVEFMPLTQTPGRWNWGYDGCNLFSVNSNYGTPQDLKCLVDACHQRKMAVILDVVYNHLGPEGNYLPFFGPFFTDKHETPWGPAVNFDDDFCEITRSMVLDNVRYWLEIYHFDALRLDAVHTIKDGSEPHILQEIAQVTKETAFRLGR